MMLQDILFALLAAQDVDPKEHVEEQLEDNFEESNEQHIEEHPNVEQIEEQEQVEEGEDQIDDPGDFAEDTRKARQDSLAPFSYFAFSFSISVMTFGPRS